MTTAATQRSGASVTITGADRIRRRLEAAQRRLAPALKAATTEALGLIENDAKRILDEAIYSKSRPDWEEKPPSKSDPNSVYQAFAQTVTARGGTVRGRLSNSAPPAIFLEFGTDDEGSGHHTIPAIHPIDGMALRWVDAAGEHFASMAKAHEVKGIVPIRFMQRALNDNREAIVQIFRRHLKGLFAP